MQINESQPESVFNTQYSAMVELLESLNQENNEQVSLYPHQVEAVLRVKNYFDPQINPQNRNGTALVVLPTGCGKTGVAILASYALNAKRVLVITPSIIISRQIYEAYGSFLTDHGVIPNTPEATQAVLPSRSLIKNSSEIRPGLSSMVMVVNAHKIGGQSRVSIEDIPLNDGQGYDLVIVDEAHHYPAPTWRVLVDHFSNSRRLFLTATPEYRGRPILPEIDPPCYRLTRADAVNSGIIREVVYREVVYREVVYDKDTPQGADEQTRYVYEEIARCIEYYLKQHDDADPNVRHQGMVLTQTRQDLNAAENFRDAYESLFPKRCAVYVSDTARHILKDFKDGHITTLVIIGRLLEGFDHKPVSVLGIVRNIASTSRVLFAQFVGRAVRKTSRDDPVHAQIVTQRRFNQRQNFEAFENLPDRDEGVEDEDVDPTDADPTDAHI